MISYSMTGVYLTIMVPKLFAALGSISMAHLQLPCWLLHWYSPLGNLRQNRLYRTSSAIELSSPCTKAPVCALVAVTCQLFHTVLQERAGLYCVVSLGQFPTNSFSHLKPTTWKSLGHLVVQVILELSLQKVNTLTGQVRQYMKYIFYLLLKFNLIS